MESEADAKLLQELLDERVHLLIRINLVENGPPDSSGLAGLLKRKLDAIEQQIDATRRLLSDGWRLRALLNEDVK